MNRISTHILDTTRGKPASQVPVRLFQADREINAAQTDSDGRCHNLLPEGVALAPGIYRLVFDITSYSPDGLYPEITICFKVAAGVSQYHIPLLLSPFAYTTYRGS